MLEPTHARPGVAQIRRQALNFMQEGSVKGVPAVARSPIRPTVWSFALFVLPAAVMAGPWEVGGVGLRETQEVTLEAGWRRIDSKETWAVPVLKLAAPLGDDLSYEVSAGYRILERSPGGTRRGAKDIAAKLMWQFLGETASRPVLLMEPKLTFVIDAASGGMGGVTTLKMPLRGGKRFGKIRLTGEVLYTHGFARDYDDLVGYGGLVEYSPDERWVVGVDLFNDCPVHDGRYHLRGNAAFKFKAMDNVELQGLIGRSVENRRGELATNVRFIASYTF